MNYARRRENFFNGGHLLCSFDYLVQYIDTDKKDYESNKLNENAAHFPFNQRYVKIFPVTYQQQCECQQMSKNIVIAPVFFIFFIYHMILQGLGPCSTLNG